MHEHFDGHRAFEHIERLAALRRLPGTPGEAVAQDYIRRTGEAIGVPMREEEFTYSSSPLTVVLPVVCLSLAFLSLIGSLDYLWGTALAIIPGVVLLAVIYLGFKWSAAFERFGTRGGGGRSMNLVGRVEGRDPKGTIILSAHYDSKSQLMPVTVRAGLYILGFFSAILLGLTLIVVGVMKAAGADVMGNYAGFYVSLIPAVCLFLLVFNFTGNRSAGALDDASGVAVILEAGRILAKAPLENHDVIIACFGCEEVGLIGSIQYLLAHEQELKLRPCYVLNYDMPFSSAGNLYLNTGFEVPPKQTSPRLNALAREAANEMGLEMKGLYMPVGAAADHMPWVKHGFEATGFVSAASYIHSAGDTVEKVNREGLRRAGEVALAVIARLDRQYQPEP
jgi:hypothetical protein